MFELAIAAFLVMFISLVGVIFVWGQLGTLIEQNLCYLVSFSAGVLLVVAGALGVEAILHGSLGMRALAWTAIGAALTYGLFKVIPDFHHHHSDHEHGHEHTHDSIDARRVLFGDSIHNIADGVLLAAAFSVSFPLGIATTLSVLVHEFLQELSEFFVLRSAGFDTRKALTINFLVSATILIGAFGGYFLLSTFSALETPLLAFSAGVFLVVVIHDLISHSIKLSIKNKTHLKHMLWFVVGIALMTGVSATLTHSHGGEHGHSHDHAHDHGSH